MTHPFALPDRLPPDLERVLAYWRGLLRGAAQMPFWDDARLTDLPELETRLFLVDAFQKPERFRLGVVGEALATDVSGEFLDEMAPARPFQFLQAQCSAAVESAGPTFFASADGGYSRLVLPMWGDGRTSMLLGAVAFG
jgi:hypothetical protein